jgi:5-formyltetrahydrofolate cyclo-ligase
LKAALRKETIARRDAIPPEERSRMAKAFVAKITRLPEYLAAGTVLTTMAIGSEWNTGLLVKDARARGKTVVLPRVSAPPRHLEIFAVESNRDLVPGVWDIPEPDPARCREMRLADVEFALVPALLADAEGFRLGYGAGYFDRLLAGRGAKPYCVIALPSDFIVERVPREPHDVPVDRVLDERDAP